MQNIISFDPDKGIHPQTASPLVRLPPEMHVAIAMECDSDEVIFALLRTFKVLYGVYRVLLYERNIRHDEGSALFKIARNGEVAAFEHLERVAKTMKEGLPALNRVEFTSRTDQRFTKGSPSNSGSSPFKLGNAFAPLHWAAAGGHSDAVQWLITRGALCKIHGASKEDKFTPYLKIKQDITSLFG
ncbi:ankyrin repeat-containing protein [Apiospora aurea]|uniref:Ankyrin repeat-containing protein n=1 Tax=Apiospora aurea TaxID=335848 RepID=A0ABR1PY40_9PEZI